MRFAYALALAVGFLVAAPYLAHRLRRKRAEERAFAAAHLVAAGQPKARRKSALEDRALFGIRALAILTLAMLGASPFVRCSRLSLQRSGGASVAMAIVLDDSMSMRAAATGARESRFTRAKRGARELLGSARDGDAVAVVLAGAPARVGLAATTDLAAARNFLEAAVESDRGTDLDGAISMGRALIAELPQVDRRVVVLSDLADGNPSGAPIGEGQGTDVWVALPELAGAAADCGILRADRSGVRVRVHVQCSPGATSQGREITLVPAGTDGDGEKVLARGPAPPGGSGDALISLPSDEPNQVTARLGGQDAIAADDQAPVLFETGPGVLAVVADSQSEAAATGGAPVVEQALSSLRLDVAVRPIPQLPDRGEELAPFIGVILDDPSGLTPEQRRALSAFFDAGGVALVALGPHAAAAPLGASLEPVLNRAVGWGKNPSSGVDATRAVGALGEGAESLADLGAAQRAILSPEDRAAFEMMLPWADGAVFVGRRVLGRGAAWVVGLPFAVDASELSFRPGFLAILDAWVTEAHARAAPHRTEVGEAWTFPGAKSVSIESPSGPLPVSEDVPPLRAVPTRIGTYRVTLDGKTEIRVAAPVPAEIDLRPRAAAPRSRGEGLGESRAAVDASPWLALALLAILAAEIALRLWARWRTRESFAG